ncbi:MAG: hypothetical protein ACYTKD_30330 [Planctomycetota bacterium]
MVRRLLLTPATFYYGLIVFAGAFLWIIFHLSFLKEGIHALVRFDHRYSLPAKLFGDCSFLHFDLAAWATATWFLASLLGVIASGRRETFLAVLLRTFPRFFAAVAVPLSLLTCWLALRDFPAILSDGRSLGDATIQWVAWIAAATLTLQLVAIALSSRFPRASTVAFVSLPLCALVAAVLCPSVRRALDIDPMAAGAFFPTAGRTVSLLVFAALIPAVAVTLAHGASEERTPLSAVALPAGVVADFVFAALAFGLLTPYHILHMDHRHVGVQQASRRLIAIAVIVAWCAMGTTAWLRRRRRASEEGDRQIANGEGED